MNSAQEYLQEALGLSYRIMTIYIINIINALIITPFNNQNTYIPHKTKYIATTLILYIISIFQLFCYIKIQPFLIYTNLKIYI